MFKFIKVFKFIKLIESTTSGKQTLIRSELNYGTSLRSTSVTILTLHLLIKTGTP